MSHGHWGFWRLAWRLSDFADHQDARNSNRLLILALVFMVWIILSNTSLDSSAQFVLVLLFVLVFIGIELGAFLLAWFKQPQNLVLTDKSWEKILMAPTGAQGYLRTEVEIEVAREKSRVDYARGQTR